ncbi:DUF6630 family protein [Montanilutibacter psychrotolerans]|uniref:DUF6630 domain-containing protein n=1 Tax=Montanilutibacter psychrotolerans TaxID=1327343 RepID=A0A3M8STX1_9GAMM|nr:hypothetical protein [Lysobacter psychrotolerans]RNF82192.1 hypothetical protein EER27_14835 [Lysobacter psychrotolerans]
MDDYEDDDGPAPEDLDEDSPEARVWLLLQLINPGDEETAVAQFVTYQEALGDPAYSGLEPVWVLRDLIDWQSGFFVDGDDVTGAIDAIEQLVSRWRLWIDWGVEDAGDEEFLARAEVPELVSIAYDQLRSRGYTLWTWQTGSDACAGWITRSTDDEAMQALAIELGIDLRAGNGE